MQIVENKLSDIGCYGKEYVVYVDYAIKGNEQDKKACV